MRISELIDLAQRHLILHGDGDVCVETDTEVLDIVRAEPDKFEAEGDWCMVLLPDMDSGQK